MRACSFFFLIMKYTDKLFIINTTVFHHEIRIVNLDFMPTSKLFGKLLYNISSNIFMFCYNIENRQ